MTFDWPWSLLGLLAVAAVAAWALFRPDRHLVNVGSLALWQRALERLGGGATRRRGRVSASWLLLLLGATAAILAASGPVWQVQRPARYVSLAIYPAAELSGKGGIEELTAAATAILDKLSPDDRVQILLPLQPAADASRWLTIAQARETVQKIEILPVAAKDLTLPSAAESSQHLYALAPAVLDLPAGPGRDVIALSTRPPETTIETFAAVPVDGGKTQLFCTIRSHVSNHSSIPPVLDIDGYPLTIGMVMPIIEEEQLIELLPETQAYYAIFSLGKNIGIGTSAYLVRRERAPRKVAMVGRDEPLIRRYIRADRELELVADTKDADIVIAVAAEPPAGKPAIVFCPPAPPPTFREGPATGPVNLASADVAAGDPVMKDVDVARLAVRVLRPWIAPDAPAQKILLSYKGDAVILRTTPETAAGAAPPVRQLFVAIDPAESNTNFAMEKSFVIFLANATSWLGGGVRTEAPQVTYESITPLQAGPRKDWTRVVPADHAKPTLLPMPGIYKDPAGVLHAVSLTGLKGAKAKTPPAQRIAELKLPTPRTAQTRLELWMAFLGVAVLSWLAGWAMRLR